MESIQLNVLLNFTYAGIGGLLCIPLMILAYKAFDKSTPKIKFSENLNMGNIAVGILTGCIILGVCICSGIVVGLGLN